MPRPEIIKRMTMLNNASSGQISTSGSSRLKRGLVKRASEPSSLPVSEGVAIAVAAPTSIAPTTPPSQVLSVKGGKMKCSTIYFSGIFDPVGGNRTTIGPAPPPEPSASCS